MLISLCCYAQEFTEGFEQPWVAGTGPNTGPPGGWAVYENGTGAAVNWARSAAGNTFQPPFAGTHAAFLDKQNVSSGLAEDWLISPQFTAPADAQIRFYSRLTTPLNDGSIYEVRISDAPLQGDFAQYEVLVSWTENQINPTYDQYTEKVIDIPAAYFGQPVYVALVMKNDNGDRWLVDEFRIVKKCLAPTAITVPAANITLNSAQIHWTDNSAAAQWEIETVPANAAFSGSGEIFSTPSPATVNGLNAGTQYKVRIRARCGGTMISDWSTQVNFVTDFSTPANDECSTATQLVAGNGPLCTTAAHGYVIAATASAQPNTCSGAADDDVWYEFTATATTHIITLSGITGGDQDLVHAVYQNNCDALLLRYCSTQNTSQAINLIPGQDYKIRIYSNSAAPQDIQFDICITSPPPPPANDACAAAINIPVNAVAACILNAAGSLYSATASPEANTCGGSDDDDVWFAFTATAAAHTITLSDITGSAPNLFHVVYGGGDCGALSQLYCSNPESSVATGLTIGNTYKVRVYSFTGTPNQTTSFSICVSTPAPAPANDDCANAVTLTVNPALGCTAATSGTVQSATPSPEANSCSSGEDDDDIWYQFTATAAAHTISLIDVTGSTSNLYHAVYKGSDCNALTQLYCSDPNSSTAANLTIGEIYKVRVYTFTPLSGQTTAFKICIGTLPSPPANDDCPAAVIVPVNVTPQCNQKISGTLLAATASPQANACGGSADDDLWYTFTATASAHSIQLSDITGSTTDLFHALYSGDSCQALTQMYCSDNNSSLATGLSPGQMYTIRIYSATANPGQDTAFTICVATPAPPPLNDDCTNAVMIPVNTAKECLQRAGGTIRSATPSPQPNTCTGTADDDVWFEFTATAILHNISITDITGDAVSLKHTVYAGGNCGALTQLYCSTDHTSSAANLEIGQTYKIRVYSFTDEPGKGTSFSLCVTTPVQPIATDNSYTVQELVEDKLIGSSCAQVNNISWKTGAGENSNGLGYFEKGASGFPIEKGIILSTGNAFASRGPNTSLMSAGATNPSWAGDDQLFSYIQGLGIDPDLTAHLNATVLEFDFVPLTDQMSFPFIFASEEYGEFQCSFSDAFAFFLTNTQTGQTTNLALLPGTNTPISVVTIRDGGNAGCAPANPEYFAQNNEGINAENAHINFNGQTVVLTAQANVAINTVYHIKLVIADRNDGQLDSAVFIGPFNIGHIDLGRDLLVSTLTALCEGQTHLIDSDLDPALYAIKWRYNGDEIPGATSPTLLADKAGTYTIEAKYLASDCTATESLVVEYYEPVSQTTKDPADLVLCNTNGTGEFDLRANDGVILEGLDAQNYTLSYHTSQQDAQDGANPLASPYTSTSADQTIYVRIDDELSGCNAIKAFRLIARDLDTELTIEQFCDGRYKLHGTTTGSGFDPDTAAYEWSGPDNFSSSAMEIEVAALGEYTLKVITAEGCELTSSHTATLTGSCGIPRGISPNDDGLNDTFDLLGLDVEKLTVLNRYGLEVYSFTGQYTDQWHGQSNKGDLLGTGTYFYMIESTNGKMFTGWVYINAAD